MEVKYVGDEGGLSRGEGFIECHQGLENRYIRVPGATVSLVVEAPKTLKVVSYRALKDASRTETTPSFPGQQHSRDLERSTKTVLSGRACVTGLGARRRTSLSTLGGPHDLTEMEVRLESAILENGEESTAFIIDWFSKEYVGGNGGFLFKGYLSHQDVELLADELRKTGGALVIELRIGIFPGFFGEWSFEGWDGGKLKFANREICSRVVTNHQSIPENFFCPEEPFDEFNSRGPHDLISLMVV